MGLSPTLHRIFTRSCATAGLGVLLLTAGCGGNGGHGVAGTQATRTRTCAAGSYRRLGSAALAYSAGVRTRAVVRRPAGGAALGPFGRLNVNGVPTVFSILGDRVDRSCRPRLYRVEVAVRPNGATG